MGGAITPQCRRTESKAKGLVFQVKVCIEEWRRLKSKSEEEQEVGENKEVKKEDQQGVRSGRGLTKSS